MKMALIAVGLFMMLMFAVLVIKANIYNQTSFVLEEATIESVHTAIKKRQITCEQLVSAYISRIKEYNLSVGSKASINAIARINVNVLDQARELDNKLKNGEAMGPLFCIPVLLKDNIDSYDSPSTSSSLSMLGNQPIHDAFLTKKLRDAGAVIFGKGTMDEFASGVSGISGGSGRTGNVYDTSKNSGGSSSGSATAVSANFVMIGIGTDNNGSVRIPAAFNGIFGLRPTAGLISQNGIFPRGNLNGTAGPLARTAEDLAIVLGVIAQPDVNDKKTLNIPREQSYATYLNENALKGKRIGVIHHLGKFDTFNDMPQDTAYIFEQSLEKIQAMGVIILSEINLPKFNFESRLNQAGEKEDINTYLASYPAVREDYYDICESERTRVFGSTVECLQFVRSLPKKYGPQYQEMLTIFKQNKIYIESVMDEHRLDALLIPISSTGSATYVSAAMLNESLASNAGLPGITINLAYTNSGSLPIGVELIGKQFSEGKLIGMAYAYEKHVLHRKLPQMPERNKGLENLDIAQYNNLLSNIGYHAYMNVLIKCKPDKFSQCLTPEIFQGIVQAEINHVNIASSAVKKEVVGQRKALCQTN